MGKQEFSTTGENRGAGEHGQDSVNIRLKKRKKKSKAKEDTKGQS